jgi:predicted nucleic acid-binding protein
MRAARAFYVTDTHPFLWYLVGDTRRLGPAARVAFDQAEAGRAVIIIPSIVLAESLHVSEKGRMKFKFERVLDMIESALNYRIYPLDLPVIRRASDLKGVSEIHDRIIVATAKHLELELITDDEEVRTSGQVGIVW